MSSVQKRIASRIMKCGEGRVWIDPSDPKIKLAITRSDVRGFIKDGKIKKLRMKVRARNVEKRQQRSGSIKGARGARIGKKEEWLKKIRPQRRLIKELKENKKMDDIHYRKMYKRIKAGIFRSKAHLMMHLKENKMVKEGA